MASAFIGTIEKANKGAARSCGRIEKRRKKLRSTVLLEMTARRLWPTKTAAQVAARAGVSTRTAEYWLSHVHNMPLEAFFRRPVNQVDSAHEWLARQRWDGVPRVERFLSDYLSVPDSPYARAVARYMWTALAGRVLDPGCEAPMVPVLIGPQGCGKSRGVKAMAPAGDLPGDHTYVELRFDTDDEKWARLTRAKLVGEIVV